MNKALIEYLIRLYAIFANLYPLVSVEIIKQFIRQFLKKEFSAEVTNSYLVQFESNYQQYSELKKESNDSEFLHTLLEKTTKQIKSDLPKKYRLQIVLQLLFFEKFLFKYYPPSSKENSQKLEFVLQSISINLNISEIDYANCKSFVFERLLDLSNKKDLLILANKKQVSINVNFIEKDNFSGQVYFLNISSINSILFYYKGSDNLRLNNQSIFPDNIYFLPKGASIKSEQSEPVYYNDILRKFLSDSTHKLHFDIKDLEFKFKNSNNGIHKLPISLESGQLVGIIGRSGVGKSTLLSLLNGTLPPNKGSVLINNYDLYEDNHKLEGLIGYIPQDDLLVEELTVFENLYLSSCLCLGNLTEHEITEKVYTLLIDLDLYEICNLKVGTPLNKFISGGQRKRLNIALELIREPWILFADEPTSGLSSSDADEIMQLFIDQTIKSRIVVMNIHQPSSDAFKLFDKILVLDKEGYPVFFGNPVDSINYFNEKTESFVKSSDNCSNCGNINHEAIFRIIEEKKVDNFGNYIDQRKITPVKWHGLFLKQIAKSKTDNSEKIEIPLIKFKKPNKIQQLKIFSKRNVLSKITNNQYILLSLLVSPILALLLSLLCRSGIDTNGQNTNYVFAFNQNIPAYLFMSVIVALFVGLIISAEEIYKDRKILKREAFLKLDKKSYLLSKISFLFFLSMIQTFLFVLIGNLILEIKGMLLIYWIILFSTSCFANVLGLLISSSFNSVVVIYILVPILIVPQLLLSGVVVQYDQLNKSFVSQENVPLVGDLMASRWAYEALVVSQFRYNAYQKNYFALEMEESNTKFDLLFVVPEIKKVLGDLRQESEKIEKNEQELKISFIRNELLKLNYKIPFENIDKITNYELSNQSWIEINNYLNKVKKILQTRINEFNLKKDKTTHELLAEYKNYESFTRFKNKYNNSKLTEIVLNRTSFETYIKQNNKLIRKIEPIYQIPDSRLGRSQFLSSIKRIGTFELSTLFFNLMIIWLMTIITSFLLYLLFKNKTI